MTGSNRKEIIRVFFIAAFLFAVVIPVFLYRARQHIALQKRSVREAASKDIKTVLEDGARVRIKIAGAEVQAEVARSAAKKTQGLSGREQLGDADGMLFLFEENGAYSFWNKDMRFALDILWIDDDTVADVSENLPIFQESPAVRTPSVKGNKALEVNAGFVKKYDIQKGDKITILEN